MVFAWVGFFVFVFFKFLSFGCTIWVIFLNFLFEHQPSGFVITSKTQILTNTTTLEIVFGTRFASMV